MSATLQQAVALHQAGKLAEAEAAYRRILRGGPQADALHYLGMIEHARGDAAGAIGRMREAVKLAPGRALFHSNLGAVLHEAGRNAEAETALRRALELDRGCARAWNNLGNVLRAEARLQEAEDCYRRMLALDPNSPETLNNLGGLLYELGRLEEAEACLRKALALRPAYLKSCFNLGRVLQAAERFEESEAWFRKTLGLDPGFAPAWNSLGDSLKEQGAVDEALACYGRARGLSQDPGLRWRMATLLPVVALSRHDQLFWRERFESGVEELAAAGLKLADPLAQGGAQSFYLPYHGLNDRPLLEKLAAFYRQACPNLEWRAPDLDASRRRGGRIRIGVASKYLCRHTIGKLYRGLIERLSREQFEVILFQRSRQDPVAEALARSADKAVLLGGSLDAMRRQVAAEKLDVLLYPDVGMDPALYFLAFARLARLQCASWGHPVTSGLESIDCFLSSQGLETAGAEEHYTERLVRLPRLPVYYHRPPVVRRGREAFGLEAGWNLYLCPQTLFKLHPDFDAVAGEILRRDEHGRLVLIEGACRHWTTLLRERFRRAYPEEWERLVFLPYLAEEDFLGLLEAAAVVLDPFPFGGGNTTYEAFAAGTPIVTWPGQFLRGRVTGACYRQMGIEEGIVSSAGEYVETAVRLARDRDWREHLSGRIRERSHQLYEDAAAVRAMERFFEQELEAMGG